jgi:hypothetical protein
MQNKEWLSLYVLRSASRIGHSTARSFISSRCRILLECRHDTSVNSSRCCVLSICCVDNNKRSYLPIAVREIAAIASAATVVLIFMRVIASLFIKEFITEGYIQLRIASPVNNTGSP